MNEMKINNNKKLENIGRSHSADIDYKDFVKIYKECTKHPFSFLTIDTTLSGGDPLRFRKNLLILLLIKMIVTDQIKILDGKTKTNEAQYNLSREAPKISALSSKDLLNMNEYLTGEDLGCKPSVFEKVKFEYSSLSMTLSKTINPADNAKKPVKYDSGLRYGYYSFVEFKRDAGKLKKQHHLIQKVMR